MRNGVSALGLTAGDEWPYERIPFIGRSTGQTVSLYSIEWLDYNQDGAIDGGDVQWVGDNSDYRVVNMPAFDGVKPKRDFQGYQLVFNKRYSNRWQMLGSFLYTHSEGMANRIYSQDMNFEGPMVTDNNWMSTLNYTINNMTGPLPFTPKFEFKLSGSYTVPGVEVDLGARFRMHSGRPAWQLEGIPEHSPVGRILRAASSAPASARSSRRRRPSTIRASRSSTSGSRRPSTSPSTERSTSSSTCSTSSTPTLRTPSTTSGSSARSAASSHPAPSD